MGLVLFYIALSAALVIGALAFAPRAWAWLLATRVEPFAVYATFRPWRAAMILGTVLAVVPILVTALVAPQTLGEPGTGSGIDGAFTVSDALKTAAAAQFLLWPWFVVLSAVWTSNARSGLFRTRADLLVLHGTEGMDAYRRTPDSLRLPERTWQRHVMDSTDRPRVVGVEGIEPVAFDVQHRAHHPFVQQRAQRRVRVDLVAAYILGFAALGYFALRIGNAVTTMTSGKQLAEVVPSAVAPIVAAAVAITLLAVAWAASRKHHRAVGGGVSPPSLPYSVLPEVRQAAPPLRATVDENLPLLLKRCGAQLRRHDLGGPVGTLFTRRTRATGIELRTVSGISSFRCTLVVDPRQLSSDETPFHRLAGAVLAHPLPEGDYVLVVPSGLHEARVHGVGIESHAFQQRYSTITTDARLAQSLLSPRTVEWLLALPDDVAIVFFENVVLVVALVKTASEVLPLLESAAVACVTLAPSHALHSEPELTLAAMARVDLPDVTKATETGEVLPPPTLGMDILPVQTDEGSPTGARGAHAPFVSRGVTLIAAVTQVLLTWNHLPHATWAVLATGLVVMTLLAWHNAGSGRFPNPVTRLGLSAVITVSAITGYAHGWPAFVEQLATTAVVLGAHLLVLLVRPLFGFGIVKALLVLSMTMSVLGWPAAAVGVAAFWAIVLLQSLPALRHERQVLAGPALMLGAVASSTWAIWG